MFDKIELSQDIKEILSLLQKHGQGYIVGGFIRDKLLGLEPLDCDFVTDIEYKKLKEIFKNYNPIEIGKHFGIIQIKINGISYEIAKMRSDIGIPKDRKVQEIKFVSDIYTDLERRDFTINAIAYDGEKYYYHKISEDDMRLRNIRFIGEIERRIKEDPLRILRGFRFAGTKNLNIKFNLEVIKENLYLLEELSIERVREELDKIICGENLYPLRIMSQIGVLKKIIPEWGEIANLYQISRGKKMNVAEHTIRAMEVVQPDIILRLTLLFHDIGKGRTKTVDSDERTHFYYHNFVSGKMAKEIMKRLKYDKKTIERVYRLIVSHLFYKEQVNEIFVKEKLNYLREDMYNFYKVIEADKIAHFPPYDFARIDKMKIIHYRIIENGIPYRKEDLAINGNDIIENFNIKGKILGEIIEKLYSIILDRPEDNKRETLLQYIGQICNKYKQKP